jgi:hypothetical protein
MRVLAIAGAIFACVGCDQVFGLDRRDAAAESTGPAGPVAWYPMDVLDGTSLPDASMHGHAGVCVPPACPTQTPGVVGGALRFDGATSLVRVLSSPELETPGGLTVTVWIMAASFPTNFNDACIVSKRYGPTVSNSWELCVDGTGRVVFFSIDPQGAVKGLGSPAPISTMTWHHVAARWDGAEKALAIDGVVVITAPDALVFDAGAIEIGAETGPAGTGEGFDGAIDELRIYDRALEPPELAALAQL